MSLFVLVEYRISALFMLGYVFLFSVKKYDSRKNFCILLLCYLLTGILDWWDIYVMQRITYSIPAMLVQILLMQITALSLFAYPDFRALFTGITSSVYVLFGNVLCAMVYVHTGRYVLGIVVQIVVHSLILGVLFLTIRKEYLWELENEKRGWGVLCIIPALFYCIIVSLFAWPKSIYEEAKNELSTILVLILTIAVYVIIVSGFSQRRKEQELNHDIELLQNHAKNLRDELQLLQEKDEEMAIIRHDLHHFINLMRIYLESDEKEKLQEMLMVFHKELERVEPKRCCENIAISGIVSKWEKRAQKNQITFNYHLNVPENLKQDFFEIEFAAVVSNLLENAVLAAAAIEEEDKERFVSVRIAEIKGRLILEMLNSFSGECQMDEEGQFLVSSRGQNHGYGLRSVMSFARKWNAIFDYSIEKNKFIVRLMVQYPQNQPAKNTKKN